MYAKPKPFGYYDKGIIIANQEAVIQRLKAGIEVAREELRRQGKILSYSGEGWIILDDPHVDTGLMKKIDVIEDQIIAIDKFYELDRQ